MGYQALIMPLIAGLVSQGIKPFIRANREKFDIKSIFAYSGMPSGHSAVVTSLVTSLGLTEGVASPAFAIAAVLAVIVVRDALGIRNYLGDHGRVLNIMIKDLKHDKLLDEHYPRLLERIGHTPFQALVGALIGAAVSVIGFYFIS